MPAPLSPAPFPLKRRRLVLGAAGALAGAALAPASVAALPDDGRAPLPAPKPLDVGIRRPNGTLLRVFTPGPTTVTLPYSGTRLLGPNYDSAMFTDFAGVTALAYLVGTATDSEGRHHNLEADIRVMRGTYVAANGTRQQGTFGLIAIGLYDPGSGARVRHLSGGIQPSGLAWTVELPDDALGAGTNGTTLRLSVRGQPVVEVIDGAADPIPAFVALVIEWTPTGIPVLFDVGNHSGLDVPNSYFDGTYTPARAVGLLTGTSLGLRFRSDDQASTARGHAQVVQERNGRFYP